MDAVRFRLWDLRVDVDATRRAYEEMALGWPEYCGCVHCRNFARARDRVYPQEALELFPKLGISAERECEVVPYQAVDATTYFYTGHFLFVGEVASGPDYWKPAAGGGLANDPEATAYLTDEFRMGFTARVERTPKAFRVKPLVQLEFGAKAPWVLPKRMPE